MVATCVEKNQLIAVAAGCADGAGRASSIVLTTYHSSKISACCLMKLSVKKKHQYFWNKKTQIKKSFSITNFRFE